MYPQYVVFAYHGYPQFKACLEAGLAKAILSVESELKKHVFETPHTASWERVFHKMPKIYDILIEAIKIE